jgi:hypothetical protein
MTNPTEHEKAGNGSAKEKRRYQQIDQEQRNTASRMWKSGASAAEIGRFLDVSKNTIVGIAFRDRVNFPAKGKGRGYTRQNAPSPQVEWTDELIAKASAMWAEQMMVVQIASILDVPVGGVQGIIKRRRDMFPERTRGRNVKTKNNVYETIAYKSGVKTGPKLPKAYKSAYDLSRMPHAKTMLEIGSCECRWALTDEGPHLFCAETTIPGKSWCAHQAQRVVGSGTISERNAVREERHIGKVAA